MNGKEYQVKAMRTNDGLGTERIMNMADNLEQGVEDNVPDTGIDLGGIINGLFGLSGEVGELTDMVKKLEKRYPDGFDVIKANNRRPEDV